MILNAIDQLGRVRIDEGCDPYRAERSRPQTRADLQADRVARTQSAHFARLTAAREQAEATTASIQKKVNAGASARPVNWLRDLYASHRLTSAVQAFLDEQAMLQERADAATDLGTIQGLLPLQPYRFATGNPPIQPQQLVAAASVVPAMVGSVANMAVLRSATDDALSTNPATRAGVRRLPETDA
ncbi:hypothetical protein [Bordetella sp. BOR01]|uniref:hypothetical protein n=1 Tax=Bordetella sp. BOR01 TaxID=2854779 RepID=UPI001C472AAB|nr:hypothetical protein [Bordetella sp. BOR01]MBV7482179.1 hypothetical protein [Bordetella sp. BOR01]